MSKVLHFIVIAIWFTAFSCARQSSPTGGPKDTIPPVLAKSNPANNETNFKGQTLELAFSEMIALANPKEQIIIAPTSDNTYEVSNRNNRVIIKFDKPLEDSSTYSINFRDAVQDVTEKNPVENLQLAFSTGSYIDSLTISGQVFDLLTGTPPKEATIAIYSFNDTLSIFKHKPQYLTKSDKTGKFILKNLKHGTYTIYALEDKNRNLITDSRSESYAYLSTPIALTNDTAGIQLPLVRLDARPLKITNYRPYNTYFNIKTSKNLAQYELISRDTTVSTFGEDQANIRIYNTFSTDSSLIRLVAQDSIGNKVDSSFYVKFTNRDVTPEKFSMSIEQAKILVHRGTFDARLTFRKPVSINNRDSILFQIDSLTTLNLADAQFVWSKENTNLNITKRFDTSPYKQTSPAQKATRDKSKKEGPPEKPRSFINEFKIGKATFVSIDKDTSASVSRDVKPTQLEDLGVLNVNIETNEPNFILQLLNTEYKVITSTANSKKVHWEDLEPGNYRIRLIIDKNNNGKWDSGNYFLRQEPEPIIYLIRPQSKPENTVTLRANWEVDDILIKY